MKNKLIIYSLIFALCSCSDFLEPKSQSEYSPETAAQLNEVLLGTAYPSPAPVKGNANTMNTLLTLVSDDVHAAGFHINAATNGYYDENLTKAIKIIYTWQPRYSQDLNSVSFNDFNAYGSAYQRLTGANAAIDRIDDVSGTEAEKDFVLGQAYALRAFYYLHLVNIYGEPFQSKPDGLGVPLKLTSDVEDRPMLRNTVREVYEQITADLLEAEKRFLKLPADKQFRKNYRVNLPMVQHLLARTYLYTENWTEAAKYAEILMGRTDFSLQNLENLILTGYTNVRVSASNDKRKFYNFISYDNPECYWVFGRAEDMHKLQKSVIKRQPTGTNCSYLIQANKDLIDTFEEGDARKQLYFVSDVYNNAINFSKYGALGKFPISLGTNNLLPQVGTNIFGQALRLAEAYLICAEANAMLYKENGNGEAAAKAVSALNELRLNRFLSDKYTALSTGQFAGADELVEFCRAERRRELCFEALRWFDQRRYGMKKTERRWYTGPQTTSATLQSYEVYTLADNDPGFTFPIPYTVAAGNPNLSQVETVGEKREPTEVVVAE